MERHGVKYGENTDQKNSEYGQFSLSDNWPKQHKPTQEWHILNKLSVAGSNNTFLCKVRYALQND